MRFTDRTDHLDFIKDTFFLLGNLCILTDEFTSYIAAIKLFYFIIILYNL